MEITVHKLKQRLDAGDRLLLLDCREHDEVALCRLPGAMHVPMQQTPERIDALPRDRPIVVYCHHGIRSQRVAAFLREQGFDEVINLTGGIDAWAAHVDPTMRRY